MSLIEILFLSLVQGLTEFLPVSSSGHLVLAQKFLGFEKHNLTVDIAVHLGTLLAVLTVYRKQIGRLLLGIRIPSNWSVSRSSVSIYWAVLVATLPTGLVGVLYKDFFEGLFSDIHGVALCFLFTGAVLFMTRVSGKRSFDDSGDPTFLRISLLVAFLIGCAQTFAIAPGVSRSGMTIAAGLFLGLSGTQSAYFSFLLAIPAILGGAVLMAGDVVWTLDILRDVGISVVASYCFGLLGLWSILKIVGRGRLEFFSYYLWALGLWIVWG